MHVLGLQPLSWLPRHPAVSRATARLRSSIKPTRSRRSRGREKAGEALPEEATSLGGSNALDARRSIWWKQPGGCSTRPAPLNPRQRRTFRPTGPPENGPSCLGNSGRPRSLTNLTDPPVGTRESDPHRLSKTHPSHPALRFEGRGHASHSPTM